MSLALCLPSDRFFDKWWRRGMLQAPMSQDGPRPRPFSMLRSFSLPDIITLMNGFMGSGAVLACMRYLVDKDDGGLRLAFILLPLALVADIVDGRVARWRHRESLMGQELDSLADVVSFGVAPAAVAFSCGMRGGWDAAVLVFFVGCGISRLARYNVTAATLSDERGKVRYFEGTPIPTSLVIVAFLTYLFHIDRIGQALPLGHMTIGPWIFHPLVLLYFASGSLMISRIRIPKL